jgi:hypothetical protein
MAEVVSEALTSLGAGEVRSVEDVLSVDREARRVAFQAAGKLAARVGASS